MFRLSCRSFPRTVQTDNAQSVTLMLQAHQRGEPGALDRVYDAVYAQLRAAASAQLRLDGRARAGVHTLSTTALVHEAFLKLGNGENLDVESRGHFMAIASRAMRQVLVEYARKHRAKKRGAGVQPLDLDAERIAVDERADSLVALDEALTHLHTYNARMARIVELRFFGGLSEVEVAAMLDVTDRTVRREWVKARAWLHAELAATDAAEST